MWNNKFKAITFSIDDGCASDKQVIEIFNEYGIKGTFNLNSGLLGKPLITRDQKGNILERFEKTRAKDVRDIYFNHEIAVHTRTHKDNLLTSCAEEIIDQVESDRIALEKLVGYKIVGMAYPCGFCDERVANVIGEKTPIKYARTIEATYRFDMQTDLMRFNPTIWWGDERLFDLSERFLKLETEIPQLFYIWGHSFELERGQAISFDKLEKLCVLLSNKQDIFYGTNKETILI